jgi:Zinc carboxypeptidase/Cytosolic carboxypeptidase N-terminal domain
MNPTIKALFIFLILFFALFFSGCGRDSDEFQETNISKSFESGNIGEVVKVSDTEWNVSLADDNDDSELPDAWRCWYYFKMENVLTDAPTGITIKNSGWPYYYLPVYSYDQLTWLQFAENEVHLGEGGELIVGKKFDKKTVWVTRFYPYTFSDLEKYLKKIRLNSSVVIQIPGYSQQGKPIYMIKVTNPNVAVAGKKRIFMHARTHPAETPSSFLIEGMIDFLLSGSSEATDLLSGYEFYIFPMQNVDGVIAGNYRSTPKSENLEVLWLFDNADSLNLMDVTPPEIAVIHQYAKKLMSDGGPAVSVALNLHASNSEPDIRPFFYPHFGPQSKGYSSVQTSLWDKQLRFISNVASHHGYDMIEPAPEEGGGSFASKTYPESWWWVNYKDNVMAMTLEMTYGRAGYSPDWVKPDNIRDLGVSLVLGIRDYCNNVRVPDQIMLRSGSAKNRKASLKYPELYPPDAPDEMKE